MKKTSDYVTNQVVTQATERVTNKVIAQELITDSEKIKKQDQNSTLAQAKKTSAKDLKYKIGLTIFYVLWAALASFAGQIIAAFPMSWILGEKLTEPGWTLVYYIITYALTITLVILVPMQAIKLYRKRKEKSSARVNELEKDLTSNKENLGIAHAPTFVDIGLAPIAYVAYLCLASVLTKMMSLFPWFNAEEAQNVGFGYYITDLDRIFAMLAIVFIAPIAEELVMRGWLYGKVRSKWGIALSILIVSLIFALLHGQWNVGVNVFALSVMLCGLREITGTIWSGMLLHVLSNGVAFYLLYVAI